MNETSDHEHEHEPPADEEGNPTDAELDVDGPNESATGHHPEGDDGEQAAGSPPPSE